MDGGATVVARLIPAAVDTVAGLEAALGAGGGAVVAQRRPSIADSLAEEPPDGPQQGPASRLIELGGQGQRMDAGGVESFVAVNVAQAGDRPLVQQQGLDLPAAG